MSGALLSTILKPRQDADMPIYAIQFTLSALPQMPHGRGLGRGHLLSRFKRMCIYATSRVVFAELAGDQSGSSRLHCVSTAE